MSCCNAKKLKHDYGHVTTWRSQALQRKETKTSLRTLGAGGVQCCNAKKLKHLSTLDLRAVAPGCNAKKLKQIEYEIAVIGLEVATQRN